MKYILENWVCKGHVSNHLRTITRENSKYLISDVQRTAKDWKDDPIKKVFVYKWATKFVKDNSELGFRRSITHLSNTDGVMKYKVTEDPSTLKCEYTFDEVFGNDLRLLQDPNDDPLRTKLYMAENLSHDPEYLDSFFKLKMRELGLEPDESIGGWDNEIVRFLKKLFKVDKVYSPSYYKVSERKKQTILSKSGTLFHINHFNLDKKEITSEEDSNNRTIFYWLFDDKLVIQYEDGKDTW